MIRRARADKHVMTTPPTPDEEDSGATATPEAYIEVTTADIRTAKRAWPDNAIATQPYGSVGRTHRLSPRK